MGRKREIAKELEEVVKKVEEETTKETPVKPLTPGEEKKRKNLKTAWKPGQSGNPKGRPKGSKNRKTIIDAAVQTALVNRLEKDAVEIYMKAAELAKAGDKAMIRMFMERLLPQVPQLSNKDTNKNLSAIQIVVNQTPTPEESKHSDNIIDVEVLTKELTDNTKDTGSEV